MPKHQILYLPVCAAFASMTAVVVAVFVERVSNRHIQAATQSAAVDFENTGSREQDVFENNDKHRK